MEIEMRDSVKKFAIAMEVILRKNDSKGGWDNCSNSYLINRLHDEYLEVHSAFQKGLPEIMAKETIDVANFAMMIFDNYWNNR